MQLGPATMITMSNIDTDQQGAGIVNASKFQLHMNQDNIMDLSFAGLDNTSRA